MSLDFCCLNVIGLGVFFFSHLFYLVFSELGLWFCVSHEFCKVLKYYYCKYFFCFILSFPFGIPVTYLLCIEIVPQILDVLLCFCFFNSFFVFVFPLCMFFYLTIKIHWYFLQLCWIYWCVSQAFFISVSDFNFQNLHFILS